MLKSLPLDMEIICIGKTTFTFGHGNNLYLKNDIQYEQSTAG